MKFKKVIYFVLIFAIIVFLFLRDALNYKDYRYILYFNDFEDNQFDNWLGIVPDEYYDIYEEQVIEKTEEYELILISNLKSPTYTPNVLFYDKISNKKSFIVASSYSLYNTNTTEEITCSNYMSFIINMKIFYRYIDLLSISDREEIIEKYLTLLSIGLEQDEYKTIRSRGDLVKLKSEASEVQYQNIVQHNLERNCEFVDINSLQISYNTNQVYVWFLNSGLVKFKFVFVKELLEVNSEILGIFGHELNNYCC